MEWKKFKPNNIITHAKRGWQKKFIDIDEDCVYAEVYDYNYEQENHPHYSFEIHIQIPRELSHTGAIVNLLLFYDHQTLDFNIVDNYVEECLNRLLN